VKMDLTENLDLKALLELLVNPAQPDLQVLLDSLVHEETLAQLVNQEMSALSA